MRTLTAGNPQNKPVQCDGFTYVVVLASLIIIGIFADVITRSVYIENKTENEQQLLFCGMAYYRAIRDYYNSSGHYPANLGELLKDSRFAHRVYLRQIYNDPMQADSANRLNGGWRLLRAPDGGISGVATRSHEEPLKKVNFPLGFERFEDAKHYSEWEFEYRPQNNLSSQSSSIRLN